MWEQPPHPSGRRERKLHRDGCRPGQFRGRRNLVCGRQLARGGRFPIGTVDQGTPTGCVTSGQYLAPLSIPTPNPVTVTAVASDGTQSNGFLVTVTPPPPITEILTPGSSDPSTVQVQTSNDQVQYQDAQYKLENGVPVIDTTDPVNWTLSSTTLDCSVANGSICGTLQPGAINSSQQFTATYTAPQTVPSNPVVTVTVTSAIDRSASDYNQITITNAPPTIAISGPMSLKAGTGQVGYTAIITNADPSSLSWDLGCISNWDGVSSDGNCYPTSKDDFKDGPGCVTYEGDRRPPPCGTAPITFSATLPLLYTPPLTSSTADYEQNSCTLNGNPDASIVPITVSMEATGCPLQNGIPTCTYTACVTITPQ